MGKLVKRKNKSISYKREEVDIMSGFKERPKLARRSAGIVERVETGNKSMDELAYRVGAKLGSEENIGSILMKMAETVEELKEEKNTGVEEKEDETKRILTLGDQQMITPSAYVKEEPKPRYSIILPNGEPDYCNGGEGCIQWIKDYISASITPPGAATSVWIPMRDLPGDINPLTGRSYKTILWTQEEILREALQMENKLFKYRNIVLCWPRGEGKCQAKGSKVLMFDGTFKNVEDVKKGDVLMGDDSTPRTVLSLSSGTEEMFEVVPNRGKSLIVTKDHLLTLKHRRQYVNRRGKPYNDPMDGKIFDISLRDYLKQNKAFRSLNALFRVPVEFPEHDVNIDPYFLGLWLGDGSSHIPVVTTMDDEVADYLRGYADNLGLKIVKNTKKGNKATTYSIVGERLGIEGSNPLLNALKSYNLLNNKHIPLDYKSNSRHIRLQVLAGIVDSDGYVNRKSIQIAQKSKVLVDDIAYLARSLGFYVSVKKCTKTIKKIGFIGEYYTIGVVGDCSIIPSRIPRRICLKRSDWKNHLVTGIKEVRSVGVKEYCGFTLDGNGRYITEDFIVTHNSFLACMIQLWKFYNWLRQQIMLGANSRDQSKFVHFDIMRDFIFNSQRIVGPSLLELIEGKDNIREKEIRIKEKGNIKSFIRSMTTATGIVSNITGYTFSEIFEMKKPKFYTQLDGSIRNVPNALGVIDSTVSDKTHILYHLFSSYIQGKVKTLFFSYRCSKNADPQDYMHPYMDANQLNDYREKFPFGEFERYFQNTWDAGAGRLFTDSAIEALDVIGIDGGLLNNKDILENMERKIELKDMAAANQRKGWESDYPVRKIGEIDDRCRFLSSYMDFSNNGMCTFDMLQALTELFDTDWVALAGVDLADPTSLRGEARSILSIVLKGLPGSRSNPYAVQLLEAAPKWLYIKVGLFVIEGDSLDPMKSVLDYANDELDGIDVLTCEKYGGSWNVNQWCEDRSIECELVYPRYELQKPAFKELYLSMKEGRLKCPPVKIVGSKKADIFREELTVFDHDLEKKAFGSTEKYEKGGIQDDTIYADAWCLYGGRDKVLDDFRIRKNTVNFGSYYANESLIGNY